jgi:uncharacterized protein YndB with AHSA1/START domain
MTKVYISTVIDAPAADVWRIVRDFNGLPSWTPFAAESRIEQNMQPDQVGCIRNFRMRDGGRIRERLLSLSDYDLTYSYAMIESQMPVKDYIASLSLTPVTEGNRTFAEWQADFDCPPEREATLIREIGTGVFQAGLTALKQRFGR